jgi:hypothetical protein
MAQPEQPKPPYDQALANASAAVEQCLKLGAVILKPQGSQRPGFGDR